MLYDELKKFMQSHANKNCFVCNKDYDQIDFIKTLYSDKFALYQAPCYFGVDDIIGIVVFCGPECSCSWYKKSYN